MMGPLASETLRERLVRAVAAVGLRCGKVIGVGGRADMGGGVCAGRWVLGPTRPW